MTNWLILKDGDAVGVTSDPDLADHIDGISYLSVEDDEFDVEWSFEIEERDDIALEEVLPGDD